MKKIKNLLRLKKIVLLIIVSVIFGYQAQAKKSQTVESHRIWINATSTQGAFCQTLFGYRAGATDGYDQGVDGAYWNDGAIALASLINDVRYTIQFKGLPFTEDNFFPLSFKATNAGTYTIAIDHVDGLFLTTAQPIYILDTQTNLSTNLKISSYTFNCNAGQFDNRFKIVYLPPNGASSFLSNSQYTFNNFEIYKENSAIVINSGNFVMNSVMIYTLEGKLLYENSNENSNKIIISNSNLLNQLIIIKVSTSDGNTVIKKWLYR